MGCSAREVGRREESRARTFCSATIRTTREKDSLIYMSLIDWQELVKTLGGQAVFLAAAAYLIKQLVSSRMERETESFKTKLQSDATFQIEAFKAKLQAEANIEIERLKSSLQIAVLEHQVRFSKLHEQRATLISQLS